ncbi:MAG: hypothetical protein NTU41_05715 [Chloroflexi bacterium]|nr:hypothetical protein [Chloroflexota bacterium]
MCRQIDCGCGRSGNQIRQNPGHDVRGCCIPDHWPRRFPTREEIIAELEEYLAELRAEVKGAEERLAELREAA